MAYPSCDVPKTLLMRLKINPRWLNKGNSGRTRSIRTAAHIEAVRDELQQNPHGSACRNPVPVPSTSFNRITRLEIGRHPYRMHVALEALLLCATMS